MNPFGDLLKIYAERNPRGNAIYYGTDKKVTWKELNDRINSLANALLDLGIKKGDKGIVMFHNCPEFLESVCALQKIGAIPSEMNYRFVSGEIEYQTNHSDSKVFLTEDLWLENVKKAKPNMPKVENYIVSGKSGEFLNYEDLIKEYPSKEPEVEVGMNDAASLNYTGGTTGWPKGVMMTYNTFISEYKGMVGLILRGVPQLKIPKLRLPIPFGSVIAEVIGSGFVNSLIHSKVVRRVSASPELLELVFQRLLPMMRSRLPFLELPFLNPAPLFHVGTFTTVVEGIWMETGMPLVLSTNPRFDPKETLELIDKVKPSWMWAPAAMFAKMMEVPDIDRYDRRSIFLAISGSNVASLSMKKKMIEFFPNAICGDAYGSTETAGTSHMALFTEPDKIKDGSIGREIATAVKSRIVNEKGEDVKMGEVGEILEKGDFTLKEYYKDQEKTSAKIKDGWVYTGDRGYYDEDGEIHIMGRMGDIINVGGEKIYPPEVEKILESNPKVEYAALIGVPDETYGEIPMAVIQLREGEEETENKIIDFCRGKMAGYKRPKSVVFCEEMLLDAVGEPKRKEIREKYVDR